MRQEQALTLASLKKAGIEPNATARIPKRDDLFEIASTLRQMGEMIDDCVRGVRPKARWTDLAIGLADVLYDINIRATAAGIDLEPFVDFIHNVRMREPGGDQEQLDADAILMATVGEKDHIKRLIGRSDLERAERGQVETCASLSAAGIPLRWPQRVALARIEAAAEARGCALAAA